MTVTGEPARPMLPEGNQPASSGRRRDAGAVLEVCPYLAADDGDWRSAYAARQHRCHALQPPALLAIAKQRDLCLLPAHASCATFVAARALAPEGAATAGEDGGASLWPVTAGTPVVLEPARRMGSLPVATPRGSGQALLIGLMVLAFLVLVIARTQTPSGTVPMSSLPAGVAAVATGSPAPPSAAIGSPSPDASATTALPTASPAASSPSRPTAPPPPAATPTARPAATPRPATRTHRVRAGDTLVSIAARYGTTVRVLARLNDIADPRLIKLGQVLRIP